MDATQYVIILDSKSLLQFASDLTTLANATQGDTLDLAMTTQSCDLHMTFRLRETGAPANMRVH